MFLCLVGVLPGSPHQGPIPSGAPAPARRPRRRRLRPAPAPPTCCASTASSAAHCALPTGIKMNTLYNMPMTQGPMHWSTGYTYRDSLDPLGVWRGRTAERAYDEPAYTRKKVEGRGNFVIALRSSLVSVRSCILKKGGDRTSNRINQCKTLQFSSKLLVKKAMVTSYRKI